MRCCWLLAMGLVIGSVGLRGAAAEEPTTNVLRRTGSAKADSGDGDQATLAALSAAVKIPPARRHVARPAATAAGKPAAIVRVARPSPYAAPEPSHEATSLDALAARLVSHNEAATESATAISDEAPESNRPFVRPAAVWTPTQVGDVEDEPSAPAIAPVDPPAVAPAIMQVAMPVVTPTVTQGINPLATPVPTFEKRESSRAGVGGANPLRQDPNGTTVMRSLDNPLR